MKIGFIGGGNMAAALIGGLLGRGFAAADLRVSEPAAERRAWLSAEFGVSVEETAQATLDVDVLVLAVKPQILREVLQSLPRPLASTTCVLSVAAGVRAGDIGRWLGGHAAVVRAMPNTPALVGAGITGLYALPSTSVEQRRHAESVVSAVGEVVWVEEEGEIDAVTAISGSGPAYVFLFIEALEAAAADLGLPPATARRLALATVHGAAVLATRDAAEPAELRARVTSKGGTTERGIAVLEERGLRPAVRAAARAAAARARELGELLGSA